jgi:hypothetical protein
MQSKCHCSSSIAEPLHQWDLRSKENIDNQSSFAADEIYH